MATALPPDLPTPLAPADPTGQAWLDDIKNLVDEMPLLTEEERTRNAFICRLGAALDEMSEMLPPDHPLLSEAMRWTDREDFEQLLDAWETGGLPAFQARG